MTGRSVEWWLRRELAGVVKCWQSRQLRGGAGWNVTRAGTQRQGEVGHVFACSAHDLPKRSSGMQQVHSIACLLAPSCLLSCAWPPCATVPGTCRAAAVT